jgi:hypothetical protein
MSSRSDPRGDPDAAFGTNGRVTELGSFQTPARLAAGPGGRVVVGAGDTVVGLFTRNFVLDPGITLDDGGPLPAADEGSALPLSAVATYAGGTVQKYEWDAGSVSFNGVLFQPDAQGAATTLIVPDDAQPHNVTLKVTTSDGLTAVRELPLEIRNAPPSLAAIGVPSAAPLAVPVAVTGVAADPGGDPIGVTVDFGDGTAPVAAPVGAGGTFAANHAYATRGTFRVTITAADDDGGATTVQRDVLIADVVGSVFREADDDGRRSTGDQPVPGATVYVDSDGDGSLDEGEPRTLSDAAGEYHFTALGTGTFFVRLNPPPGLRATIPPGQAGPVVVDDDGPGARRDFGLTDRARISGIVFDDANANGVRDGSEAVLTGAFRSVYLDLNNDGWRDAGEPVAPLSSSEYVFANLDPGTYVVRYSPPLGAGGAILKERAQTFPSDRGDQTGHVVTLGRGGASAGNDFGSFFGNTPVTGVVYDDRNGNGNRESSPAEPPLDRVVYLDFDNDGTLDPDECRVRSNNSQAQPSLYLLPVVRGRTYTVRTMMPAAWAQTEPAGGAPYVVTVDPQNTGALQGLDFGTRRIAPAAVVGRHLFYFKSAFGGTHAFDAENDLAVAPDKQALLPGGRGAFANVSSYARGINGLMIDLNDLKQMHFSEQLFRFDVRDDKSNVWTPVSSVTTRIEIRRGAGVNGSDRVVVVFGDRAIWDQWLRVTVLQGTSAGLAAPDVFYFGHLADDVGGAASPPRVDALDLAAVRRAMGRPAPITHPADFNRDGRVDALDLVATRQNAGRTLTAFAAPAQPAAALRPAAPADTYRQTAKRRSVWEEFA